MADSYGQTFYPTKMVHEDRTVYEAALDRLVTCYNLYDNVVGWYSGGKDGQLCMEMMRRAQDAMGRTEDKTRFIFIDQELIEDEVISTVEEYFANPRFEGVWLAMPRTESMVIMGQRQEVTLWDKAREADWPRVPPPYAVSSLEGLDKPVTASIQQKVMVAALRKALGLTGSICLVNGSRFAENPTIRMALTNTKSRYNWITHNVEGMAGVDVVKPVYDWSMLDVFRFYYEEGVAYPAAYDINFFAGTGLRAGTPPLDAQVQEKLLKMRETYPKLFVQITAIWPELLTQQRYVEDVDVMTYVDKYGAGWSGMGTYIKETMTPEQAKKAMQAITYARRGKERYRTEGKMKGPCYGFPVLHVWRALVKGDFRDGRIPRMLQPSKEMLAFEARAGGQA